MLRQLGDNKGVATPGLSGPGEEDLDTDVPVRENTSRDTEAPLQDAIISELIGLMPSSRSKKDAER